VIGEMNKYIFALLALGAVTPPATAQCAVVPNTGTAINPSFNAGRCEKEGGYCFLGGKDQSVPEGKCATTGKPPNWGCQCLMQGNPTPYFVLNPGVLSTINAPRGTQTAGVGVVSVNGFSGTINIACSVSGAAGGNANPSCALSQASITTNSSGGFTTLSVTTSGIAAGNYTVNISAAGGGITDSASLPMTVTVPKVSGGGVVSWSCFAVMLAAWILSRMASNRQKVI